MNISTNYVELRDVAGNEGTVHSTPPENTYLGNEPVARGDRVLFEGEEALIRGQSHFVRKSRLITKLDA